MSEVQAHRAKVVQPNDKRLHVHANLYFAARNPMMYRNIKNYERPICVLRINSEIMKLGGVIISDKNASSDYVRFGPYPDFLNEINWKLVFAESWYDPDKQQMNIKRSIKCAEVLVPRSIPPNYITGIHVRNEESINLTNSFSIHVSVNKYLFFQ